MNKENKEATVLRVLVGIIFYAVAFFMFIFVLSNVAISLYYQGVIDTDMVGIKNLALLSCAVGVIAGVRLWLSAWLRKKNL